MCECERRSRGRFLGGDTFACTNTVFLQYCNHGFGNHKNAGAGSADTAEKSSHTPSNERRRHTRTSGTRWRRFSGADLPPWPGLTGRRASCARRSEIGRLYPIFYDQRIPQKTQREMAQKIGLYDDQDFRSRGCAIPEIVPSVAESGRQAISPLAAKYTAPVLACKKI